MAGQVRLHQHPDFAAFVTATAAEHHLREPFVEKDYWITEILRTIATTLPDRAIFKGGTSLSKGWGLLDRFSEDIDLFVDPAVDPPLARRAIDRTLKRLRDDVAAIDGLELQETRTVGGFGRIDTDRAAPSCWRTYRSSLPR
jgi:predicted nucleotidyltransferase component of viral defense system